MKRCTRCGEEKEPDQFPNNAASPDGKYSLCKACRKKKSAEHRAKPEVKQREKERLANAYQSRRDELLAKRSARYAANKDKERAKQVEWREKNLERHRQMCRDWAKNNPGATRALVAKRRSSKIEAGGHYSKQDIDALLVAQEGKCNCCRCDLDEYHVDHVIPLSRGGSNWPNNLQILCPTCNRSKGNKLPHEFEEYRAQKQQVS